jgi:hypothetical protein
MPCPRRFVPRFWLRLLFSTPLVNNRCKASLPCPVDAPFSGLHQSCGKTRHKRIRLGRDLAARYEHGRNHIGKPQIYFTHPALAPPHSLAALAMAVLATSSKPSFEAANWR